MSGEGPSTAAGGRASTGTRQRLIDSTIQLLETGGYAAASVGAVTSGAGVASGTLYRHFPSKAELFVEVFRTVCEREEAAMRAAAEKSGDTSARIEAVVSVFAERALSNPRLAWALLAEPVDPLVDAERIAFRRRYSEIVARLIERALEDGQVAPQDPALSAAALVGAIGEALVGPLAPSGHHQGADLVPQMVALCRRAVGLKTD